jgi:hypothetical protein
VADLDAAEARADGRRVKRLLHALCGAPAIAAIALAACGPPHLLPLAPSVVPTTFAVRLHRPQRAGDRGILAASATTSLTTITEEGDQIVRREEEHREVDLKAALKVLRVSPAGESLDLELTVESLVMQTAQGRHELLAGGKVVSVARGKDAVHYASPASLPPEAEKALDEVFSPHSSEVTDDDIFGIREPQALGAVWPVNAALAAKELGAFHLQIPPDGVSGDTHLVALAQVSGTTCLDVAGELFLRDVRHTGPDGGPPTEVYEVVTRHRHLLPLDPSLPELDGTSTFHLDMVTTSPLPDGREARTSRSVRKEKRRRFTPQPPR